MAEATNERDAGTGREPATGMPRWVKVFGIITAVVVLLLVIILLIGSNHGPSRHNGGLGGPATAVLVAEQEPGKS